MHPYKKKCLRTTDNRDDCNPRIAIRNERTKTMLTLATHEKPLMFVLFVFDFHFVGTTNCIQFHFCLMYRERVKREFVLLTF